MILRKSSLILAEKIMHLEKLRIKAKRSIWIAIGACAVLLTILMGYFFCRKEPYKEAPPVYEEIYSISDTLNQTISQIDYAIYRSFYRIGVKEEEVSFLKVIPKHQNGHIWEFTELLIKMPYDRPARNLENTLNRELEKLGPIVVIKKEKENQRSVAWHIFTEDFYTHKLILKFALATPRPKDLRPKIAIIIDDLGYNSHIITSFLKLDLPLSFSVLPLAPFTERIVRTVNQGGFDVILHLPMEPKNYPSVDPGPGALFLSMDENEIKTILDRNLNGIKNVKGVSNHMGSRFTENGNKMRTVLKELKRRGLFYIDSRTTAGSVGFRVAKEINLPTAKRSVFLDNDLDVRSIRIQVERLLSIARHSNYAIGIAHPHKETLKILEEYKPRLKKEFQMVPISELVS